MKMNRQRILVIDGNLGLAELVRLILGNEGYDVTIARSGEEGYQQALHLRPDLILMDVVLPGMDGYTLCRQLRQKPATRSIPILILSSKTDIADKVAGFEAGADDFLNKPFQPAELTYRIRSLLARFQPSEDDQVERREPRGRIIALFGTKGGVGKTTICVNLAVALQQRSGEKVALWDADFFFGDVGTHLNLPPDRSVLDLIDRLGELEPGLADQVLVPHASGIRVLLGPYRPEEAERITSEHVERLLDFLSELYKYVVIDCAASYDDRTLVLLEQADEIFLVVTPEIGPLKNTSIFLDLALRLGIPLEKVHVILNRSNSNVGIEAEEIERALKSKVEFRIVSGGRPAVLSVNRGVPLMIEQPDHPIARQVMRMADGIVNDGHQR